MRTSIPRNTIETQNLIQLAEKLLQTVLGPLLFDVVIEDAIIMNVKEYLREQKQEIEN